MTTRYLFFCTAKAAIFQFYAFVLLLVSLVALKFFDITHLTVVLGTLLYIAIVVPLAFYIDRTNVGNRGV